MRRLISSATTHRPSLLLLSSCSLDACHNDLGQASVRSVCSQLISVRMLGRLQRRWTRQRSPTVQKTDVFRTPKSGSTSLVETTAFKRARGRVFGTILTSARRQEIERAVGRARPSLARDPSRLLSLARALARLGDHALL